MAVRSKAAKAEAAPESTALVQIPKDIEAYTNGQPVSESQLVSELAVLAQVHAASGFEMGKRLVALKSITEHGRFTELIEGTLHIGERRARELMSFARICIDAGGIPGMDQKKLQSMDAKKVLLLGDIIPDYADELTESGTIAGRDLDEWDAKSRDELRSEIRQLRTETEKQAKKISDGRKQLADKDKQLASYKLADETAIQRACLRIQQGSLEGFNEFVSTARQHLPKGDALTRLDKVHIKLTIEHLHQLHTTLIGFIEDTFLEGQSPLSAEDLRASEKFLSGRSMMLPPSILADPFADAPADDDDDDEAESPAPSKARNGKKR